MSDIRSAAMNNPNAAVLGQTAQAAQREYASPGEVRQLERLRPLADEVAALADELNSYAVRFSGPGPCSLGEMKDIAAPTPPLTYAGDIDRLSREVDNLRSIVQRVSRLG